MKPGAPASLVLHAAVLGWALFSFAGQPPLEPQPAVDSLPVELLPPTDVSQLRQGQKTAKPSDQPTPKDAKAATKENDGKRVGDAAHEEPPPPPPETKPTPPEATPKPPDPKPQQVAALPPETPPEPPKKLPEPKPPEPKPEPPKPEPPKPVAKPEPAPTPPPPKPDLPTEAKTAPKTGESKPPEVKQPPKDEQALEKLLEQKAKEPPKEPPKKVETKPETKPAPKTDPVKTASTTPATAPSTAKPTTTPASPAKPTTSTSKLPGEQTDINNREVRNSSTAKTDQHASLGTPTAPASNLRLSQSQMEALIGQLRDQITKCWTPPPGASESGVVTRISVQLNPDGTLKATPQVEVVTPASHPQATQIVNSAIRAVKMCAAEKPFTMPADKYAAWAVNHVTFDPKLQ